MLPVYLGKARFSDAGGHVFEGAGNCFGRIQIRTDFAVDNVGAVDGGTVITADIAIDLSEPYSFLCMEHFLMGTPFQDTYEFYLTGGTKRAQLKFAEAHHRVDLLMNGLRFFSFCAGQTSILSALLQTGSLFAGGFGGSKFVPFVGSKIPDYMIEANVKYLTRYMGKEPEKRVI
jgi:hypothetical protein